MSAFFVYLFKCANYLSLCDAQVPQNLSQEELAHQASLHNTYIGQLERGEKNATIESLLKITNALGITIEEFFCNTQTGPKTNSLEITRIINLLEDRSSKVQRTILGLLELLIDWKRFNCPL